MRHRFVLSVAATAVFALTGCGDDKEPPAASSASTTTAAVPATSAPALIVPQQQTDTAATSAWRNSLRPLGEGRWGDFWDTWDAASQAAMSRDEYLRLTASCTPGGPNLLADQMELTLVGDTAILEIEGIEPTSPLMRYEGQQWRRLMNIPELRADPCMEG